MSEHHEHAGCQHHSAHGISEGKLRLSIALTLLFVGWEAFTGWRANSLALLSDAGHNFTDALALILSAYAIRTARKPADSARTFGYHRVGILAALFNAATLLIISVYIFYEAFDFLRHPHSVDGTAVIQVACVAVLMNSVVAWWLRHGAAHDVNVRSAFLHMLGDALSAAGVVVSGFIVRKTGWSYADPLMSVVIGVFIAWTSWGILKETIHILLEGTPRGLDVNTLAEEMLAVSGVVGVHDLHAWSISDGLPALSSHIVLADEESYRAPAIVREIKAMLAEHFAIHHVTIETTCGGCTADTLLCDMPLTHVGQSR